MLFLISAVLIMCAWFNAVQVLMLALPLGCRYGETLVSLFCFFSTAWTERYVWCGVRITTVLQVESCFYLFIFNLKIITTIVLLGVARLRKASNGFFFSNNK